MHLGALPAQGFAAASFDAVTMSTASSMCTTR
jgi:hypothetical protein